MRFTRERSNRRGVQDQLRTAIRRAGRVADGLDREVFNREPEAGAWSVGQCLEHLNATARLYLPAIAEAVEGAREEGRLAGPGSPARTMLGRLVVWSQEPPPRFKMTTWSPIVPGDDLDPDDVLESFEALHEELIVRINEAADLDWKKVKMRSELMPRLKLSLGDWFHFLAAHVRRHLWQAERARERVLS